MIRKRPNAAPEDGAAVSLFFALVGMSFVLALCFQK
jgi:hypothetical protein